MKRLLLTVLLVYSFIVTGYSGDVELGSSSIQCIEVTNSGSTYVVFIDDAIGSADTHRPLSIFLNRLKSEDTVYFRILTPGGSAWTSIMIYNNILDCKAKTIADIHVAYSGGSIIAVACEEIRLHKFSRMLVHGYQLGGSIDGSSHEISKSFNRVNQESKDMLREIYKGFLSRYQMQQVLNGVDLFLTEDELREIVKSWKPVNLKHRIK